MTTVHVSANDRQDYGYQWWRQDFACGSSTVSVWHMSGNGGNKVAVLPEIGLAVVITAQLYGTQGMHEQTSEILEDFVLAATSACGG